MHTIVHPLACCIENLVSLKLMFGFHHTWFETTQPSCIIEDTGKLMFNGNIKFITTYGSSLISYKGVHYVANKGHQECELFTTQMVSNANHISYDNKSKHVTIYC